MKKITMVLIARQDAVFLNVTALDQVPHKGEQLLELFWWDVLTKGPVQVGLNGIKGYGVVWDVKGFPGLFQKVGVAVVAGACMAGLSV